MVNIEKVQKYLMEAYENDPPAEDCIDFLEWVIMLKSGKREPGFNSAPGYLMEMLKWAEKGGIKEVKFELGEHSADPMIGRHIYSKFWPIIENRKKGKNSPAGELFCKMLDAAEAGEFK